MLIPVDLKVSLGSFSDRLLPKKPSLALGFLHLVGMISDESLCHVEKNKQRAGH